ncbi:Crp/Fnr family transcriptional regulator [Sphingobacterium sp. HMA12]|uniref:Crp/Fnr family transcriptional regulator n=1 Tax=Sphingobacterium sp. HMA12 TaxID=2050894 RepID=UPI001F2BAD48|nr:Crp/Fnr family transcriptional regulator [Sphingobacterium sp. HMA12]
MARLGNFGILWYYSLVPDITSDMVDRKHFYQVCNFAQQYNISFTRDEFEIIRKNTQHMVLPPHTVLMEQGKLVKKMYFMIRGIARLFRIHDGVDHTLGIESTNYFLSTPLLLQNGQESTCALESLSEIEVLVWNLASVTLLKEEVPRMKDMEMAIMDRLLGWLQDNQVESRCMTAEERYYKLMETQPKVIQNVPQKYIASLLGIHQDSLSRIRKGLGQRGQIR